jgi:PhzF family phenazine biosynthesis protein
MSTPIWIVDAFVLPGTHTRNTGNPAAVMIVDEFPSDDTCLSIAGEMNLSETAFVKVTKCSTFDNDSCANQFHIRWFTPATEVDLCGHATLAAAHILFHHTELTTGLSSIQLHSKSGPLTVRRHNEKQLTLDFPAMSLETASGKDQKLDASKLSSMLGLLHTSSEVVAWIDNGSDVLIELSHDQLVRELVPNMALVASVAPHGVIVTAKCVSGDYDFVSRFFAPNVGVPEDPVTGSAHCKLAPYWSKRLGGRSHFRAYQASPRGGDLTVDIVSQDSEQRILLTGTARTVLQGSWLKPLF